MSRSQQKTVSRSNLSRDEVASKLQELRAAGKLADAIDLCDEAQDRFPNDYFYSQIKSDLLFQLGDYSLSFAAMLEYIARLPSGERRFSFFARRYYRLRKAVPVITARQFASKMLSSVKQNRIDRDHILRCIDLVKDDLPDELSLGADGQRLLELVESAASFHDVVKQAKTLETDNPAELKYVLDRSVLSATRSEQTIGLDAHWVSVYERMEEYESALNIAEEILEVRLDVVVVRALFRICRGIGNYDRADRLLERHPSLLKDSSFNVLYEFVYYFESKNDLAQVRVVLGRMEKQHMESVPIQRTVKNFYLRFGLVDDMERVNEQLQLLTPGSRRFGEEVTESEAEVGSKIKELYSALEHKTRLAAISDLTKGISHELGQPITNIRYTLQFYKRALQRRLSRETVFQVFDSILEETERMGHLVGRLAPLTSSKSSEEPFDVVRLILKRVKAEEARLFKARIRVTVEPRSTVQMTCDAVKFEQVISNLLLNAIDACRAGKRQRNRITIRVYDAPNEVQINFTDTGIGIPAKNRGKVFDPFFSTKGAGKGEGLGLFIVWNVLKMEGGKIVVDPEYKAGARFLISVPKSSEEFKEE